MFEALAKLPQGMLLGLVTWNLSTSLWAWPEPVPAPAGPRRRPFRIIVPAHDEAHVVGVVLTDIAALDYPAELLEVWVVADRCTDDTAQVALSSGANVDERSDGADGKGAALAWHLDRNPPAEDTALIIVDADNRLPTDLLARFADELDAGAHALQGYLDVTNPDESLMATASALTYWAGNRMVQQARRRLGWSADLGGTGMCLTPHALQAAGGFGGGLTEDADLGVRLALAGVPVTWIHDIRIRDEKPAGVGVTLRQRARWMAGKRTVARERVGPLLRQALADRNPCLFDVALRLVQPGRSFVALASAALAAIGAATGTRWLFAPRVWAAATAAQLLAPVVFLARDGTPPRYLVKYPLVTVVAALWLPVRVASGRVENWYHTPHRGA